MLFALLLGIVVQAGATAVVYSGPLDHTYNLVIGSESYPIRYGMLGNGIIENMTGNSSSKSIVVIINDNSNKTSTTDRDGQKGGGLLAIQLPRKIIDANTTEFAGGCSARSYQESWTQEHDVRYHVFVNGLPADLATPSGLFEGKYVYGGEQCERDSRILTVYYPPGNSMIVIQGTVMIPEFGLSLSALVLAVAVITAIVGTSVAVRRKA